ncbi:sugar transferase [bacterium]|nr:sugar transferase [bacterium]
MRILYVDQYFSTREGKSGTRSYEFAKRFVAAGHQVTMLTTASHYSHMAGQQDFFARSIVDGIEVRSFRIAYAQKMGYARRALSFAMFLVASTLYGALLPRHDVVFASSTPLTVGITGAVIGWLRGVPFVFEVRDLWPRAPIELGVIRHPVAKWLLTALERWIYRRAARINALSPGMVEGVVATGIDPARVSMIPNSCDLDLAADVMSRKELRQHFDLPADAFVIAYAGAMGPANDLADLLRVAEAVREDSTPFVFLLMGEGPEDIRLRALAKEKDLTNVVFTGPLPRQEVARVLGACDMGVTIFARLPVLATNSPNKMFDYLACGLPQMTNSPGWVRDIVENGGAGIYWTHNRPDEAAAKLRELASDRARLQSMARRAREIAEDKFDRAKLAAQLLDVFDSARDEPAGGWPILLQGLLHRLLAAVALLILSPFLLYFAWRIRAYDGGPVLYSPERAGLGGRLFHMRKFRTMVVDAERRGLGLNVTAGDERITPIGRFLRDWSLDELPQLINVLLGEMRLVGPRPALPHHVERYTPEQHRRLRVRPGLTGWAQVNGRNLLSWDDKLALDAWYADHQSLWLDVKVILRTIGVVIRREGLYEPEGGLDDPFNQALDADRTGNDDGA